jgi:exosome complex component RRP41
MIGIRKDLRTNAQSRAISMHIGGVNEVDGASKYSQGKTSVLATVIGPVIPKFARHEKSDKCNIEIEVNYASNIENLNAAGNNSSEFAILEFLKSSLIPSIQTELFPRKLIVIQVLILQNEGSIFSVALNSCILALLDASIPMFYYMTCVEIAVQSNTLYLDPVEGEEKTADGIMTICIKGNQDISSTEMETMEEETNEYEDKIISMQFKGLISAQLTEPIVEAACKYSKALSKTIRETIATKISTSALY